jgi:NADH-quinone oxidoreductase subunit M
MTLPLLSILIWFPIACGIMLLFWPENRGCSARFFALGVSILCFIVSCLLLFKFDPLSVAMQWTELKAWIPNMGIRYHLGIDGFSLPLIILTCFMTILVVLGSYISVTKKIAGYLSCFLIMQGLVCGAFAALDSILFYIFWEGMLIPMFLIIGVWGAENRIYATIKFFLIPFWVQYSS